MRYTTFSALLLILLICICACTPDLSILSYQSSQMHLAVTFERQGVEVAGDVMLGAGGEARDILFTISSPAMLAGTVYGVERGTYYAKTADTHIPLGECPDILSPFSLFAIPLTAEVTNVEKTEEGRVVTLMCEQTIYTLTFWGEDTIPAILTKETPISLVTLRVTEIFP